MLTEDEKAEIRREYRLAKNKPAQIGIFCDLYLTDRNTILEILELEKPKTSKKDSIHSAETKKKVLRAVWEEGLSASAAGKKYGVPPGTVSRWKKEGRKIEMGKETTSYAPEVRREALRLVNVEKLSHAEAGERLGVKTGTISYWVSKDKKQNTEGKAVENGKEQKQAVFTPLTERVLRKLIADGKSQRRYILENALLQGLDLKGPEEQMREILKAEKEFSEVVCNAED